MSDDAGPAAALVLAAVLAWAGLAKARRPAATAASFADLGLPAPGALAVAVPAVEVLTAAALVLAPAPASWVALALLGAFSAVVVRALLAGRKVPCPCFGSAAGGPVSSLELVRNAGLAALAVLAGASPAGPAPWPAPGPLVAVAAATGAAGAALGALRSRQRP